MKKILLACDLNRTVLPDGPAPVSGNAYKYFKKFVEKKDVAFSYMTGMHLSKSVNAIEKFDVPYPDYLVCDVGTSLYVQRNGNYKNYDEWQEKFRSEWRKLDRNFAYKVLSKISYLRIQEKENQSEFKLSFYFPVIIKRETIDRQVKGVLSNIDFNFQAVISYNIIDKVGYLDVLPKSATKGHALEFMQSIFDFKEENIVYAGDSGNDIEPLTIGYKGIIVNNADKDFKNEVLRVAEEKGLIDKIYLAKGGYRKMNGNYVAGILEGLEYFGFV